MTDLASNKFLKISGSSTIKKREELTKYLIWLRVKRRSPDTTEALKITIYTALLLT